MSDQWYFCPKCGFEFPANEMKSHSGKFQADHKGWNPWKTDSKTEESNQDEEDDK